MSFVTIKKFRRALLAPRRPLLKVFRELCCFSRSHDRTVLETKADSETALPIMGREAPGFERR